MKPMKHILLLFIDGIGLGEDTLNNPFAIANLPTLNHLTNGHRWLRGIGRQESERSIFVPLDAQLGVAGRPQSGTNQAVILTGQNVPHLIGRHYGPKPDEMTRAMLQENNLFLQATRQGKRTALIEAYPPGFHRGIARGKSLPSSYQLAAISAGQELFTLDDLRARRALAVDWTGAALRDHLKSEEIPVYHEREAGHLLVEISRDYDFAMHSHWLTDMVGHRGSLEEAVALLELLDAVIAGVLEAWKDDEGLVILTSDHGNMEEIGDRRHTENEVPALVIGAERHRFARDLHSLLDLYAGMIAFLGLR